MAGEKDQAKRETLSLRLHPKTKFMLEFTARMRGQTLTMLVERAIRKACAEAQPQHGEDCMSRTLVEFTDSKIIRIKANPSEFTEGLLLALTSGDDEHWAELSRWGVRCVEAEKQKGKGKGDDQKRTRALRKANPGRGNLKR